MPGHATHYSAGERLMWIDYHAMLDRGLTHDQAEREIRHRFASYPHLDVFIAHLNGTGSSCWPPYNPEAQ